MAWADEPHRPRNVAVPRVVVDHRPTGDDRLDRQILLGYRELNVAVLLGDHLDDPRSVDRLSVTRRATATGVATIATITGRDRGEGERTRLITGFVDAGVAAVLCVTGDHPAVRFPHHVHVDFESEGTLLANEARRSGAVVAVAESPAAPPQMRRSIRLRAKQDAGADFAILNHSGSVGDTLEFVAAVHDDGLSLRVIAPVPVVTDQRSVDVLTQFPGVTLPPDDVSDILDASDSQAAGIDVAVRRSLELLDSGLVSGVNLAGIATGGGPKDRSSIMRHIARELDGH